MMTIEEELKYLKQDIANLFKELNELKTSVNKEIETCKHNIERALPLGLHEKVTCSKCLGTGRVYESPICDAGQKDFGHCKECKGKGYRWR